jgi:hypothetical protein
LAAPAPRAGRRLTGTGVSCPGEKNILGCYFSPWFPEGVQLLR